MLTSCMKTILLEYLKTCDKKFGVRYLYKRNPDLWNWISIETSFLPVDAKPKQRVWHIVNNNYNVPLCPIDNVPVKWHENRYLVYSSLSAKSRCPAVTKKRIATYRDKTGHGHWHSNENKIGRKKYIATCFAKFEGMYPSAYPDIKKKIENTKIKNGIIRPREEREAREIYNEDVEIHTKHSWYYSYSKINPNGLERGKEYHLDHVYSRKAGFDNNVPAEVIGHWTNLQMLPAKINNGKGPVCDKTLQQLLEDYNCHK